MAAELRVGVAGLGSVAAQILPSFREVPGVRLAAAADLRKDARDAFRKSYDLPAYADVAEMCRAEVIDVVVDRNAQYRSLRACGRGGREWQARDLRKADGGDA